MSMPTSAIASTAAGLTSLAGSDPPDQATARPPARWLNQPSAICDRPALWTQRNRTRGRSGGIGRFLGDDEIGRGDSGPEEPGEADGGDAAGQLGGHEGRHGGGVDAGEAVGEGACNGDGGLANDVDEVNQYAAAM